MNPLDCDATRAELVAHLDGELDAPTASAVDQHLSHCAECVGVRDAHTAVWGALDHLPGLEPRPGWLTEVQGAILAGERGAAQRGRLLRFPGARWVGVAVAAAAAVVIALGLGLLKPDSDPARDLDLLTQGPAPQLTEDAQAVIPPDAETPQQPLEGTARPEDDAVYDAVDDAVDEDGDGDDTADGDDAEEAELAAAELELEGISEEELEMLEDLEVLVMLDELDEMDVLETLELLEDLDDAELVLDET